MARDAFTDYLQVYPFWLMDVGPTESINIPVLTPIFGFSGITMPEIQLEVMEVKEGNWPFNRKVVKGGSVGNITLSRGVLWEDSDFWRWITMAALGDTSGYVSAGLQGLGIGGATYRRSLVLIQYHAHVYFPGNQAISTALQTAVTGELYLAAMSNTGFETSVAAPIAIGAAVALNTGPFEFAARVPARAFLLKDVIPTRYKTGADLDSGSSGIQIQELDLAMDSFEEITLAG